MSDTPPLPSSPNGADPTPPPLPPYSGMGTIITPVIEKRRLRKLVTTLGVFAVIGGLGYAYHERPRSHPAAKTTSADDGHANGDGYRTPLNTVVFYLDEQKSYGGDQTPGTLADIKSVTCPQDIAAGKLSPASATITSFKTVDSGSTTDYAHVDTTIVTKSDKSSTRLTVPMVKDGGKWLVCFTSTVATGGTLAPLPAATK